MRHCIYIATLLLWTTFAFGQLVQRQVNETAGQFATRFKPDNSVLTYKVVETNWNAFPVIVAFYDQTYKIKNDNHSYHRIIGTIFIKEDTNSYGTTTLGTIETAGGDPTIEAAFFANSDTDRLTELIVIASWQQRHYDVHGTLYGTFIFDYELTSAGLEWTLLNDISKKLDGGCECNWRDGTSKKAKFKTEADIKAELLRLGYQQ